MEKSQSKNLGGRPPLYSTPEALQVKIDQYFKEFKSHLTLTGLILFCGFCDLKSLYDMEKRSPEFSYIIKTARTRVAHSYEKRLRIKHCTGAIFALKNLGWSDRTEVEHSGEVKVGPRVYLPKAEGIDDYPGNGHSVKAARRN